jgi:hypothetical protein
LNSLILDVLALNWLNGGIELVLVLGVLVELGEDFTDVVHEQLGQFFIGLEHETKELAMVVVNYV